MPNSIFNLGCSLSSNTNSVITIDPDIPEAHTLRSWFDSVGSTENFTSISQSSQRSGFEDVSQRKVHSSFLYFRCHKIICFSLFFFFFIFLYFSMHAFSVFFFSSSSSSSSFFFFLNKPSPGDQGYLNPRTRNQR